jgi:hypothetical protein
MLCAAGFTAETVIDSLEASKDYRAFESLKRRAESPIEAPGDPSANSSLPVPRECANYLVRRMCFGPEAL